MRRTFEQLGIHTRILGSGLLVFAGLLVDGADACATTYCVGTAAELTSALAASENGEDRDEIRIRKGQYSAPDGGWHVNVQTRGISIDGGYEGQACQQQTLDASLTVLDGHHAERLLTIMGPLSWASSAGLISVSGLTIQNGRDSTVGGIKISDWGPIYNGPILVERNIFRNNESTTLVRNNSAGGLLAVTDGENNGGLDLVVRNNLFVGNSAVSAPAAMLASNDRIHVTNNTVVDNKFTGSAGAARAVLEAWTYTGVLFANNMFWGNDISEVAGRYDVDADLKDFFEGEPYPNGPKVFSLFNNDYQLMHGDPLKEVASIHADPQFIDGGQGDFRIAATSASVDAGLDGLGFDLGLTDVVGGSRWNGSHVDIGAYESGAITDEIWADGFDLP